MWDKFETIWRYPLVNLNDGGSIFVSQIVLVLFVLLLGYIAGKVADRLITRRLNATDVGPDAVSAIRRIVYYSILLVVLMTALSLLRIPLTAFAFISGAVAIGVGFGAQNIINNFISGWILMLERPIRIGDFVEVDGAHGVIEKVGNRSTRIRRTDGVHILVPNSQLLEQKVVNWTLVDRDIRNTVRVGVAYGSPVRRVAELIRQAIDENESCKTEPAPVVIFEDFGDNALIFDAYFWSEVFSEKELRLIRSELRFRIEELFNEAGIVIAFPQRDVHLDSARPIEVRLLEK
ncbi:MAG TPA: mechanosensitive ion channel domain-containing protein [Woeseiaceae bacterium]